LATRILRARKAEAGQIYIPPGAWVGRTAKRERGHEWWNPAATIHVAA
jgi:hypothetical protein